MEGFADEGGQHRARPDLTVVSPGVYYKVAQEMTMKIVPTERIVTQITKTQLPVGLVVSGTFSLSTSHEEHRGGLPPTNRKGREIPADIFAQWSKQSASRLSEDALPQCISRNPSP